MSACLSAKLFFASTCISTTNPIIWVVQTSSVAIFKKITNFVLIAK